MDKNKPNYNAYIWNVSADTYKVYHRDAFIIWCLSDRELNKTHDECLLLYECMNDWVQKDHRGFEINNDKCKKD